MKRILLFLALSAPLSAQSIFFSTVVNGSTPQAATPTFSPGAGAVSNPTTVTISDPSTGCGAYIYWNLTGAPTTGDTHGTSVSVTSAETIYAKIIGCPGYTDSAVGSAAYTITGGSPIALVDHKPCNGASGCTTASLNSTTASLLVVTVVNYTGSACTGGTVTSSPSTTWTCIQNYPVTGGSTGDNNAIWYAANPTTGATQTVTCSGSYMFCDFSAWTNVVTSTPVDVQGGQSTEGPSPLYSTSITPTVNNDLCVVVAGGYASPNETTNTLGTPSVAYTVLDTASSSAGNNAGGAAGYSIQTTAGATSTTYTINNGSTNALSAAIACFKHN